MDPVNLANSSHDVVRYSDCPRQLNEVRRFEVCDELVLFAPDDLVQAGSAQLRNQALTLNMSGRVIWELCDGSHSLSEIVKILHDRYSVDSQLLYDQVNQVVSELSRYGMVDGLSMVSNPTTTTVFTIGIEDKPYFWWQTAILLESFRGKLPKGWRTFVVVCNNGRAISAELQNILDTYDTDYEQATNHAESHRIDIGYRGGECHAGFNRVEALTAAGKHVADSDVICLLDSDIFLFNGFNFDIMPTGCAVPRNWHIDSKIFFSTADLNQRKGVDLRKLLAALGCEREFKPGGVNVFVSGSVAKSEKFIADCFRFGHALFLLGRAAGATNTWICEMPCYALAMTANAVEYSLLEQEELLVSSCDEMSLRSGTLYHYYSDPKDPPARGGFHRSSWCKQNYFEVDLLQSDLANFTNNAVTDHERYFFQLAKAAKDRLNV